MREYKHYKKTVFSAIKRLFCRRNIIIVAEHDTGHIPLSAPLQLLVVCLVLGGVSWLSYSTGSYMKAQNVIAQKERSLESTQQENSRIASEFALLKRDLVKLADQDDKGEVSEYTQFMIEQYNLVDQEFVGPPLRPAGLASNEERKVASQMIFERVNYLENVMEEQKQHYEQLMDEIEHFTDGEIKEIEQLIKRSGLDVKQMEKRLQAARRGEHNPQGGPFIPEEESLLANQHAELYNDLDRLVRLQRVRDILPLARPMREARITSGFGSRRDPFTGRRASHSGTDFVNKQDRTVRATGAGKVVFAGRKGAYGNFVEVDHGLGIHSRYAHLASISVHEGQRVTEAQKIGIMGSTGRSTGAHLHYEVRLDGRALNPYQFVKAGDRVRKKEQSK